MSIINSKTKVRPIGTGSRDITYKTRGGKRGVGRCVDRYETCTGPWFIIEDNVTKARVTCRAAQIARKGK